MIHGTNLAQNNGKLYIAKKYLPHTFTNSVYLKSYIKINFDLEFQFIINGHISKIIHFRAKHYSEEKKILVFSTK